MNFTMRETTVLLLQLLKGEERDRDQKGDGFLREDPLAVEERESLGRRRRGVEPLELRDELQHLGPRLAGRPQAPLRAVQRVLELRLELRDLARLRRRLRLRHRGPRGRDSGPALRLRAPLVFGLGVTARRR